LTRCGFGVIIGFSLFIIKPGERCMSMVIRWLGVLVWVVWAGVGVAQEVDPDKASQPACCYGNWKGTIGPAEVDPDKAFQQGDFEQAVASLESQLPKLLCDNSPADITSMRVELAAEYTDKLVQLASAYQSMGLVKVALDRLQCAESIAEQKLKNSLYHANVLSELSRIYLVMGDVEYKNCQFTGSRRRAAREENLTKAISYAGKAIEAMNMAEVRVKDDTNLKLVNANILNNYGNILMAEEKYGEAIRKYEEGAKFADGMDLSMETKILLNKAQAMVERKSKGDFSYNPDEYIMAIENAKEKIEKLPSKREKLFHLTGLAYIVQDLLKMQTDLTPGWWSCPNSLLEANLYDEPHDDAVAFAKNYLARSYADIITNKAISNGKTSGCGDSDREKSANFIEQAIREVQSCPLLRHNYKANNPHISGFKVYLPSLEDKGSKEQCQEECQAICSKDYLSPCKQDRASPCKTLEELKTTLSEGCKGNCDEIPSLFPQDHGICGKTPSSFLQSYHPEWLFNLQWQLGRIYKAQKAQQQLEEALLEEAICPYERAATYLQLVQKAYGYPSISQRFSNDKKQFYLDRADLLLQVAKVKATKGMKEDEQNLLKAAMDSIESLQETSLQNYFQDECVTEKFSVGKERRLQNNEVLVYLVMFSNRIESVLKFSDGPIIQQEPQFSQIEIDKARKRASVGGKKGAPIDLKKHPQILEISSLIITKSLKTELNKHQIDTILFVPSGELLKIPFAALLDGEEYLIENYAIAVLPNWRLSSISPNAIDLKQDSALLTGLIIEPTLSKIGTEQPKGKIDDPKVCLQRSKAVEIVAGDSRSVCTKPLCYVDKEIKGIEGIIPNQNRTTLLGANFTVGKVEGILKNKDYSIIHFSTHGYFDQDSKNSWLCTYKKDETLTLDRLEELLQGKQAKLLTLSACETALGAELGLAGIGVKVGTQSALGSLWPVDDESTTFLMQEFYKNLKKENLKFNNHSIARALQKAQLSLLRGSISSTDKEKIFDFPYYWAGFLLIGNWQNQ
jgi:CHAT domain-containing protein